MYLPIDNPSRAGLVYVRDTNCIITVSADGLVHADTESLSRIMLNEHIDGLVQKRRISNALAMELRLSCTDPSIWYVCFIDDFSYVSSYQAISLKRPMSSHKLFLDNQVIFDGILPKGPYLPCVSMTGRALLAGYPRFRVNYISASVYTFNNAQR